MRVGLFGGQFDPPHLGHLAVVRAARDQLGLDLVLVVPAAAPPHRPASDRDPLTRLRLTRAAFSGEPRVEVSGIELERGGPSYTVDTLTGLAGEDELFLILGADQYAALDGWHESRRVRELASIVVAPRPGFAIGDDAIELRMEPVDLSSSELRERLARGEPARGGVPEAVAGLIESERLYVQAPC